MRVLHAADIHLGELSGPIINGQNARLLDTLRCFDFMVEYAEKEKPDAILIAGDLFDKSKLWADNMLILINAAADRLADLAKVAPVVLMYGTSNHDNMQAFENLNSMSIPGFRVVTAPGLFITNTNSGYLQIGCLPGFDKGYFRTKNPGMTPAEENQMCSKLLGDMVNGLSAQLDPTIPSVLMAHYTVVGCELDNGQHVFTQSEVVLPKEAMEGSTFDLVALGHIHRAQRVEGLSKPVFYSGPINGITFNEEGQDKGFWMHEIHTDLPYDNVSSEFIKTPSRKFWTTSWNDLDVQEFLDGKWPMNPDYIKDKIIRVHYSCTDELNKQLNRKALERALYDAGAFHVAEIKPEKITTELVKQELTETSGPMENLLAWTLAEGLSHEEVAPLIELARPLIATVSAKMPTGTLSGMFEPRILTVKNYRSYLEETFNFADIYFATVNGKNGIGKSAFFMDAISDCLYEEPRTGVTGSWITNGQTDGMIEFEFSMGTTVWRVVRNRSIKGSGKITLALQEYIGSEWANRSGTTTKETQEKIEVLLGMDCATFQCTALIMQDAYGKFMEADKEARMSVLANILGLGVYEQLTDLAKAKVTELNRELTVSKAKLTELDEKLKVKPELEGELESHKTNLKQVAEDITLKESELKTTEELVRTLKTKAEKAEELQRQITTLSHEITVKQAEIVEKSQLTERAKKMLETEDTILAKAAEYEQIRDRATVLETKLPRMQELKTNHARLFNEINTLASQTLKLRPQINELERVLASKPELDIAAAKYNDDILRLQEMDILAAKEAELHRQIIEAEKNTDRAREEIREKGNKLSELIQKTQMLSNSNCIDPLNAKCAFLADAQKAKANIPVIEQELRDMEAAMVPLLQIVTDLKAKCDALGYNATIHYDLRNSINLLRPKAELAGQLESKNELLTELRKQLFDCEKRGNELQTQFNQVNESITVLQLELGELPMLNKRLPKLLAWVKAKEELPAARMLITSTQEAIEKIEANIEGKCKQTRELESERVALEWEIGELPNAENMVKFHCDDLRTLQDKQNSLHAKLGALIAQLQALAKDDEERRQLISDMGPTSKTLINYQTLARAFGNDGIPFSIVRSVVPELSIMANDILGKMTGGQMALEIQTERVQRNKKEVNAIEVLITDWRGTISYGNRSGGQRVKAALANAFALADLKARRAGIQLGMMWVDEPPFLDSEGTEAYCDALELLNTRNQAMKVIAISHDQSMKARFPQQIEVVDMGEQGSKVRMA